MIFFLVHGLVLAGACILVAALPLIRRLIAQLPQDSVRRKWYVLAGLIVFFIFGYLGYVLAHWNRDVRLSDLVVPTVFFFGACFVYMVINLLLRTTVDVRRMATLEHESITDLLTGLYNRRYAERRIEEEAARAGRYGWPLSILLVDLDNFKQINDCCGHSVGDLALTHFGKLITQMVRDTDIAARYGGDEIIVIAPNTPLAAAACLAERLRQAAEASMGVPYVRNGESETVSLTVSIGVACRRRGVEGVRELIESADRALYQAKRDGRNRVAADCHDDSLAVAPGGDLP